MKGKFAKRNALIFVVILLAFAVTSCDRARPTQIPPETILQATEQDTDLWMPEGTEAPIEANGSVPQLLEEEPIPPSIDWRLIEPISEMHMVFVEGESMVMQGQEISLDSFYMSRYVLNLYLYYLVHEWAQANGHHGLALNMGWSRESDWTGAESVMVGWEEAMLIANLLSIMEGLTPVYWTEDRAAPGLSSHNTIDDLDWALTRHLFYVDWEANGYRLPTEAEWEFAARGGNESRGYIHAGSNVLGEVLADRIFSWDHQRYVPGQMRPNELGIYDMTNRASEWVQGPWTEYGELYPAHNPGRLALFDFTEPFFLLQKNGGVFDGNGVAFLPENRTRFQTNQWLGNHDPTIRMVAARFVRGAGL